jgi:hypothetical protein
MIVIVGQSSVAAQSTDQLIKSSGQQLSIGCRLTACKQSGDKVQGRHRMSHDKQTVGMIPLHWDTLVSHAGT